MAVPRSQPTPVPATDRKVSLVLDAARDRFRDQSFSARELGQVCMAEHGIGAPFVLSVLQTQVALGHMEKTEEGLYRLLV